MLTNTFCHIPHIGTHTESRLWHAGLLSWHDALRVEHRPLLHALRSDAYVVLQESFAALDALNPRFFAHLLPHHELWRLFPEFRSHTAFLDIETTGVSSPGDYITTIALYDGSSIHYYVNGYNLAQFLHDVQRFSILVTYNGKQFDIPYIERFFNITLPHIQIDLRFILKSLGFSGGLKACERALGLHRGELDGLDGYVAVLLWREYHSRGNRAALETLLAYNIADAVNLETLMVKAYNLSLQSTPFYHQRALPLPQLPHMPFSPDAATIARLKSRLHPA